MQAYFGPRIIYATAEIDEAYRIPWMYGTNRTHAFYKKAGETTVYLFSFFTKECKNARSCPPMPKMRFPTASQCSQSMSRLEEPTSTTRYDLCPRSLTDTTRVLSSLELLYAVFSHYCLRFCFAVIALASVLSWFLHNADFALAVPLLHVLSMVTALSLLHLELPWLNVIHMYALYVSFVVHSGYHFTKSDREKDRRLQTEERVQLSYHAGVYVLMLVYYMRSLPALVDIPSTYDDMLLSSTDHLINALSFTLAIFLMLPKLDRRHFFFVAWNDIGSTIRSLAIAAAYLLPQDFAPQSWCVTYVAQYDVLFVRHEGLAGYSRALISTFAESYYNWYSPGILRAQLALDEYI
mmetsp:Transcript_40650/g.61968  ORF Transcript_40650/g.61968 Transcript_40650/m.61968 type:complete len:351 (+) Transcript_40650:1015-2067(+)|eukprot:CAMPEP_0170484152 /NCGR_PEP_ID=MMETSP0208-20121228/3684_1 /TAXON_ID=197538 /ORGANISM="Strombidium inclinatum, Strain S3" /LENGTH=350 /DNA_ID=CAMNT_0010757425 /DNA_START=984 /DNA_END=2036 /DNA_ORIENTATION=-